MNGLNPSSFRVWLHLKNNCNCLAQHRSLTFRVASMIPRYLSGQSFWHRRPWLNGPKHRERREDLYFQIRACLSRAMRQASNEKIVRCLDRHWGLLLLGRSLPMLCFESHVLREVLPKKERDLMISLTGISKHTLLGTKMVIVSYVNIEIRANPRHSTNSEIC